MEIVLIIFVPINVLSANHTSVILSILQHISISYILYLNNACGIGTLLRTLKTVFYMLILFICNVRHPCFPLNGAKK